LHRIVLLIILVRADK